MYFTTYKKFYLDSVPLIFKFTTISGLFTGIYANGISETNGKKNREFNVYANLIGYTTIGMVTGITYPISFPLFTYYSFYQNNKQSKIIIPDNI